MVDPTEAGASVYFCYDDRNVLIYVGITIRRKRRQSEHAGASEWWPLLRRMEFEHYATVAAARERESQIITHCHPPFNRSRSRRWAEIRGAYLGFRETGTHSGLLRGALGKIPEPIDQATLDAEYEAWMSSQQLDHPHGQAAHTMAAMLASSA